MSSLDGKVALVTGGASGIGAGIARVLATAGARVAIGDLDEAAASAVAGQLPGPGLGVRLDVTSRDGTDAAVTGVESRFGPVDVLVMPDGALLVSDDYAGAIYRITYSG